MPTLQELQGQVGTLSTELDKRSRKFRLLDRYREGDCPYPDVVLRAGVTRAYRMLMPMSDAPWGGLVVDSKLDRLEVNGIHSGDKTLDDLLWNDWQSNQMDSESKLAHDSALTGGRAYAIVWADEAGDPEIVLDNAEQMIIQYEPGSRRHRVAALRRWSEGNVPHATLYRPEAIYKFKGPENTSGMLGTQWEKREVGGEAWPLPNPLKVVNVVEIPVNRRLKPGVYGYARGEFEHCTGLIDRINLLTFLGLVVAFWMGFPLRGVIGDKIAREVLRDDAGNKLFEEDGTTERTKVVPPFDVNADSVFQLENPDAKLASFQAADRKNLSVMEEIAQLAAVTHTPRHYFPLPGAMSNIAADTIRADEGGMNAAVTGHKGSMGEGWEETLRLCALVRSKKLARSAALEWADHESRSLAERADAASKLKDILPWQALAERVLNATSGDIARWEGMRSSDALGTLLQGTAAAPAAPPAPAPAPAPVPA